MQKNMENLKDRSVGGNNFVVGVTREKAKELLWQLRGNGCRELLGCTHKRTVSSTEKFFERKLVDVLMALPRAR